MERPERIEVFVDTTAFYALMDPTHAAHAQVRAAWDGLLRSGTPMFTSSYVCAELRALVQVGLGFERVRAFLDDVKPHVTVLTVDSELHARALTYGKRDLGSLIPRTSRALMRRCGVATVFTLDGRLVGPEFRKVEIGQRTAEPPAEHRPEPSRDLPPTTPPRKPRSHGARRGPRAVSSPSIANPLPSPPARPELMCRRALGSWRWEVALAAPDECNVVGVRLNDTHLRAEQSKYHISSYAGVLSVDHADGGSTEIELCAPQAPMIFKLADRWRGVGRRIDAMSRGHFVVIAPTEWHRRGRPPVAPDATADPSFQAHYFFRDGRQSDDGVGFEECDLALTGAGFSLTGECLHDDSTDGTLYIGKPPELRPGREVTWARVGEERDGGWRGENFLPAKRSLADVLDHRQGRFFVRVYDSGTKLCDSGTFRYVESLREILVDGKPYTQETLLPPAGECHTPIKIKFVGEEGAVIRPSLNPNAHHQWVEEEVAIVAESHPDADEVVCALETPSGSVDVSIRLPRIWWCLGRGGEESTPWSAVPLAMTRREFRYHANADATVQICIPRQYNALDVGFDQDLSRSYRSTLTEESTRIVELPLIDFADDSSIDRRFEEARLHARCGTSIVSLVRVLADNVPEIVAFQANPAVVRPGNRATLRWITRSAADGSVSIRPGFGQVSRTGSITFTPKQTTRYEISIATGGREALTRHVVVTVAHRPRKRRSRVVRFNANVPTPQIILFYASPVVVRPGDSATLYWATRNVQDGSVFISPTVGRVSHTGSIKVTPERSTKYRITVVTKLSGSSLPRPRHAVVAVATKRKLRRSVKQMHRRVRRPDR